jgi:hypothetical protein
MNLRISILSVLSLFVSTAAWADKHDADRYPEDLPEALEVADDESLAFVSNAIGFQIYDCKASGASFAWTFRAPDADLYAQGNGVVGTHYAGPTWEWNSGGYVVAAVAARVSSPDPTAIPWLRLGVVASDGPGVLSHVTTILRLDTVGGLAPTTGCSADTVGEAAFVPYEATYYFYRD